MGHDLDDDASTPSAAEIPEGDPPGTPTPRPDGVPRDHPVVLAAQTEFKASIEPLLAISAAAQTQFKASIEPLLAISAATQTEFKASIEPLLAISAAAQTQFKASIEPLLAISAAAQTQFKASIEPLLAISAATQSQLKALTAQFDVSAVRQLSAWTKQFDDVFEQITRTTAFRLPEIDRWIENVDRWIPSNLHGVGRLDVVFAIALDEGIPLSWIPCPATVASLVEADGPQERVLTLTEHRDEILDHCDAILAPISHEWVTECRDAIRALREGHYGSAQSHASNIIDSIVLALAEDRARDAAVELARREIDDVPYRSVAKILTLRPLARAFTPWWPSTGAPPPAHFSRHATSHAVGRAGVFKPEYALTAIMLATSLIVQFEPHAPPTGDVPTLATT